MNTSRKTISITDDDPAILEGMQLILEHAGFATQVQSRAKQLIDRSSPFPDLFLLDKQLIGIDGLDACRYLKAQPETAHIPIVIISATPHVGKLAAEAGADDFIEKPFQSTDLLDVINRHLGAAVQK
jgi:CheY-like chemotaxis protein